MNNYESFDIKNTFGDRIYNIIALLIIISFIFNIVIIGILIHIWKIII